MAQQASPSLRALMLLQSPQVCWVPRQQGLQVEELPRALKWRKERATGVVEKPRKACTARLALASAHARLAALACEAAPLACVECVVYAEHEACDCTVAAVRGADATRRLAAHAAVEAASGARTAGSVAVPGDTAAEDMAVADTIAGDSEAREVADSTVADGSRLDVPGEDRRIDIHAAAVCSEPSGSEACRAS